MAERERALKLLADFLEELSYDGRIAGMTDRLGWSIQQRAAGHAQDVRAVLDDLRQLKIPALKRG